MPNNESFEGYLKDIQQYWNKYVINVSDVPKDMNVDRIQCPYEGCLFTESSKSGLTNHQKACQKKTVDERLKMNPRHLKNAIKVRRMYFIKTTHDVLRDNQHLQNKDDTYAVYKLGKSDNTDESRMDNYLKNGTLESSDSIIDIKDFVDIGVEKVEKELLKSLKQDKKIIQRTDITSDNKGSKTAKSKVHSPDKKDVSSVEYFSDDDNDTSHHIEPREKRQRAAKDKAIANLSVISSSEKNDERQSDKDSEYLPEISSDKNDFSSSSDDKQKSPQSNKTKSDDKQKESIMHSTAKRKRSSDHKDNKSPQAKRLKPDDDQTVDSMLQNIIETIRELSIK